MIKPLSTPLASPFAPRLGTFPRPAKGDNTPPLPVEQVSLKPMASHREPKESLAFLENFDNQLGLSSDMKDEKHQLMAESSHAFFRASPALFYHDLQSTYFESSKLLPDSPPRVAIVGDAHVLNAGTFRGPDGQVVWGLNDFDQAEVGSPEWDLERMGVSLYVAGRSGGLSKEESLKLVRSMGQSYLNSLSEDGPAFLTRKETSGEIKHLIDKSTDKAKDHDKFLDKWASPDRTRLVRDENLVEPDTNRGPEVLSALKAQFDNLKVLDFAAKPHSGGSTRGLERYYALVQGVDGKPPWILETKEVLPTPVLIPDGDLSRGDGSKILHIQKQMGSPTDERHKAFKIGDIAFFTREREPEKGSLKDKPKQLTDAASSLGKVLAHAHNSSGADLQGWVHGRDEQLLDNLANFSQKYSRQVESDFRDFQQQYAKPESKSTETSNPQAKGGLTVEFEGYHLRG